MLLLYLNNLKPKASGFSQNAKPKSAGVVEWFRDEEVAIIAIVVSAVTQGLLK